MKQSYLETIRLIERLHRRFLDVIKTELDRLGIEDINNVQTLILSNISNEQLTVGELTARLLSRLERVLQREEAGRERLSEPGALAPRSPHDARARLGKRSGAHSADRPAVPEQRRRLERQVVSREQLAAANQVLSALERYWSNYITYSPLIAKGAAWRSLRHERLAPSR